MVFFKLIKIFTVLLIIFCFRFKWNEASVEQKVQFKEMFSELIKKVSVGLDLGWPYILIFI